MAFLRQLWGNFLDDDIHERCQDKLFINVTTLDDATGQVQSRFMSKFGEELKDRWSLRALALTHAAFGPLVRRFSGASDRALAGCEGHSGIHAS